METYVYDEGAKSRGDVILDFVDSDGPGGNAATVSKRYLWGQAVDQLFAQEDVAKTLTVTDRYVWLLQDKLGTVRDVLDRSGGIVARVECNAFGVITSVTNAAGQTIALPTRWLYTCQEYDPITGNIWFSNGAGRGRWYSPTQNRFLQPDELGFAAGDMNLYRPVGNSPTNATDSSGQNAEEWLATLPWQYQNFFSEEQRTVLVFGYYSALFKLERAYLLARAQYLRKAIERFEPYASSCSPGTRGGNMIAGMKQELTEIQSRFAENVAQAAELEARFNELGLHDVDFNFVIPNNDDRHSSHFGKGLSGARNLAAAFMSGWTGQSGGLQPSWDPFDVYAAGQGLVGLARGVMGLGRSAIAFGKNVREFSKALSRSADDFVKELDEARNVASRELPCPGTSGTNATSVTPRPADGSVRFRRWKRGEAIDKPMPDGSPPTWETVQSRYWKNRYEGAKNSGEFTRSQLAEMRKGNAPMDYNPRTRQWERRELHHVEAQRHTVNNSPLNIRELTPDWHAEVDPLRRVPGITPNRGIR